MTREDIIRMAREAEIPGSWDLNWFDPYLERFAALVAAHEREECAKTYSEVDLADVYKKGWDDAMLRNSLEKNT